MFGRNGNIAGAAQGQAAAEYAREQLMAMPQTAQQESEVQYAARVAGEALHVLEKSVAELEARLQTVLTQEPPSPVGADKQAVRSVTSPMAAALMAHGAQTDAVARHVQSLLRRIAL